MKDKVLRANVTNAVEKLCHELRAYSGESMTLSLTIITRAKGAATPLIKGEPDWYKTYITYTDAVDKDDGLSDESARIFYGPDDFGAESIERKKQMAKKAEFEIYEGLTKRKKKYLVFTKPVNPTDEVVEAGKKFFKCSVGHLLFMLGYIFDDDLYFSYHPYGAKQVLVVTYIR